MADSKIAEISTQNFSRGLVTVKPDHLLEEGESPSCSNIDFSRSVGRLTKRRGYSLLYTALGGSNPVSGLGEFVTSAGVATVVASVNSNVYALSGAGTWTSIFAGAMAGAAVNFATYNDLLVIVSSAMTTQKWTGSGSTANLLGTPPANVKYVKAHRNRLWMANSSAGASRLHYSALNNAEDWTTAGDAGFIDIGKDDGEQITGLASVGPYMVIFKQNSVWVLKNGTPTTFVVTQISKGVGCVAPRSIVECESFALFLSNSGVYAANQSNVALMSYNVQPDFDSMSNATKALAVGGRLRTQYWLSVDTDANSVNDTAYVLDYVYGIWGKYSNKLEKVYLTRQDGTLISGSMDSQAVIRKHDDTSNDNGSAITFTYDSPGYEFDDWVRRKQLHDIVLKTNAIAGKTVLVSHLIDGTLQANTKTFNLDAVIVGNSQVIHKFYHPPDTSYGLVIRIRISNAETSADLEVYGYSLRAKMRERENG